MSRPYRPTSQHHTSRLSCVHPVWSWPHDSRTPTHYGFASPIHGFAGPIHGANPVNSLTDPTTRQDCDITCCSLKLGLSASVPSLAGLRTVTAPAHLGFLGAARSFANLRDRVAATWSEPPRSPDMYSASAAPCRRCARVTRVISHGDCPIRHHHGDAHHNPHVRQAVQRASRRATRPDRTQRAITLWCRPAPLRADTFGHNPCARVPGSCTLQRRPLRLPGHSPLAWLRRHQLPCPTNRASHLHMPQQWCCPARP